jgi:hypothetical protein
MYIKGKNNTKHSTTIHNIVNTSTYITKTTTHYKTHTHTHNHTLQNPHIHKHSHITKQVKQQQYKLKKHSTWYSQIK